MAFQAYDREFNPVNTSQATLMADSDLGSGHGNRARAESRSLGLKTKPTSMAQDLDRFKEQFYQWYFLDKYQLKVVKQKFDQLFEIIRRNEGQSFQAEEKAWRNCLRSWNTHWKLRKNGADRLPYPADLDRSRVYYEGYQPLFNNLPSGRNMDEWPNAATGPPTVPLSQPSVQSYDYGNSADHARNDISEHDFAGEARPQYGHPLTEYAPEYGLPFCEHPYPPHIPMPVAEAMTQSTGVPYRATGAGYYAGGHLGIGPAQENRDILRQTSAPDAFMATKQYATTSGPDEPQPRSLSISETLQSSKRFPSLDSVASWPDNKSGGVDGEDSLSRKRPSRSSFMEPPSVRVKSPHSNTPLSANRPQRCTSALQSTFGDEFSGLSKDLAHIPMPNQDWGASAYISQPTISSSTNPSTISPSTMPQATSQKAYVAHQDWSDFTYDHGTKP